MKRFNPITDSDKIKTEDLIWVNALYKLAFPTLYDIRVNEEITTQKKGVDKYLCICNSRPVRIDEKLRHYDYGDLLLEDYSNYERRTPGWARDKLKMIDYIAYITLPAKMIWFIFYPALRQYFLENYSHLLSEYVINLNPSDYIWGKTYGSEGKILYKTANIPVPLEEFPVAWLNKNFWRYAA